MAQHSIEKLAKQGDPRAIAYLITQTLKKYRVMARASLNGHCLKVLLEAEQVPPQAKMVQLVSQGLKQLNVATIQTVKLYGRCKGTSTAAWRQVLELTPEWTDALVPHGAEVFNGAEVANGTQKEASEAAIQLDDLDPEAMILFPVEKVQLDDLDPEAMILFPVEPEAVTTQTPTAAPLSLAETAYAKTEVAGADHAVTDHAVSDHAVITSNPVTNDAPLPAIEALSPRSVRLPRRLTGLLLICLWLRLLVSTLMLVYSLLNAGSVSLYTGLDLSNTNPAFAGLLSVLVSIASFIFSPLDRFNLWLNLITVFLSLVWLHRFHASLRKLFQPYPISPSGAVARFIVPIYNLWGIANTFFTLAHRLDNYTTDLKRPSQTIRRLTGWLYFCLFLVVGLQGFYLWLRVTMIPMAIASLWFYVARDGAVWLLSLVWLRLILATWRAVSVVYREKMAAFLPIPSDKPRPRSSRLVSLRAILLGGGASLLSLILFNCLLGVIVAIVFVSNDLRPESILPTFYDSESLLTLVLMGSFVCIGLGGFLAAHLAATAEIAHAFGLGVLLTLIGLALQRSTLLPGVAELPFWFQSASMGLIIPAALIGGWLRQWFKTL